MQNKAFATFTCCLTLFLLSFPANSPVFGGPNDTGMQQDTQAEAQSTPVPGEKEKQWESLQNVARKDYDICLEHCGNDQNCFTKCKTAYENRLDRELKMLLNETKATPDK